MEKENSKLYKVTYKGYVNKNNSYIVPACFLLNCLVALINSGMCIIRVEEVESNFDSETRKDIEDLLSGRDDKYFKKEGDQK